MGEWLARMVDILARFGMMAQIVGPVGCCFSRVMIMRQPFAVPLEVGWSRVVAIGNCNSPIRLFGPI